MFIYDDARGHTQDNGARKYKKNIRLEKKTIKTIINLQMTKNT